MPLNIVLQNADELTSTVPSLENFTHWVNLVVNTMNLPLDCEEVTIRLVDKEESAELNQTYRHKTGPTNILSFPFTPLIGMPKDSLGDLAICVALVEEESLAQHKDQKAHWAHLTIHGILHLCGFDHVHEKDALIMESREIELLNQLGYQNPYES